MRECRWLLLARCWRSTTHRCAQRTPLIWHGLTRACVPLVPYGARHSTHDATPRRRRRRRRRRRPLQRSHACARRRAGRRRAAPPTSSNLLHVTRCLIVHFTAPTEPEHDEAPRGADEHHAAQHAGADADATQHIGACGIEHVRLGGDRTRSVVAVADVCGGAPRACARVCECVHTHRSTAPPLCPTAAVDTTVRLSRGCAASGVHARRRIMRTCAHRGKRTQALALAHAHAHIHTHTHARTHPCMHAHGQACEGKLRTARVHKANTHATCVIEAAILAQRYAARPVAAHAGCAVAAGAHIWLAAAHQGTGRRRPAWACTRSPPRCSSASTGSAAASR